MSHENIDVGLLHSTAAFVSGALAGLSMRVGDESIRHELERLATDLAKAAKIDHPLMKEIMARVEKRTELE